MKDKFLKQIFVFGIVISATAAMGFGLYFIHTLDTANTAHVTCPGYATGCTLLGHVQATDFFGLVALAGAVAGGAIISLKSWLRQKAFLTTNSSLVEAVKKLSGDEKAVYDAVTSADGTIFQSDLVKQLGFSKVKLSRILDRLEAKGLVERRRRGMANLVVLKRF